MKTLKVFGGAMVAVVLLAVFAGTTMAAGPNSQAVDGVCEPINASETLGQRFGLGFENVEAIGQRFGFDIENEEALAQRAMLGSENKETLGQRVGLGFENVEALGQRFGLGIEDGEALGQRAMIGFEDVDGDGVNDRYMSDPEFVDADGDGVCDLFDGSQSPSGDAVYAYRNYGKSDSMGARFNMSDDAGRYNSQSGTCTEQ